MASGSWSQKSVGDVNASGSWIVSFSRDDSSSSTGTGTISVTLTVPNGDEMWWYADWSCGGKSGRITLNTRYTETIVGTRTRSASFTVSGLSASGGSLSYSITLQRWNDSSMIGQLGSASGSITYEPIPVVGSGEFLDKAGLSYFWGKIKSFFEPRIQSAELWTCSGYSAGVQSKTVTFTPANSRAIVVKVTNSSGYSSMITMPTCMSSSNQYMTHGTSTGSWSCSISGSTFTMTGSSSNALRITGIYSI